MVVLLGPSGSGKSTLLNIMGGLDRPTSGKRFFRDVDLTVLEDRELTKYRREHVGFVFQFYNLVPSLTAYENVALVTEVADNPMRPADVLALVDWAVFAVQDGRARTTIVKIGHRNNRAAEVLSGLSIGMEVVLHPSDRMNDNTRVTQRGGK